MNDYNSAIKILVTLKYSGTIKIAGVMWAIDNDADTFQRWGNVWAGSKCRADQLETRSSTNLFSMGGHVQCAIYI